MFSSDSTRLFNMRGIFPSQIMYNSHGSMSIVYLAAFCVAVFVVVSCQILFSRMFIRRQEQKTIGFVLSLHDQVNLTCVNVSTALPYGSLGACIVPY